MNFVKNQLVKSSHSEEVYWIVSVDDNIYTAEDAWGETHDDFCDDDFKTLTINDDFEKLKGLHNSGYKISITCRRSLGDI